MRLVIVTISVFIFTNLLFAQQDSISIQNDNSKIEIQEIKESHLEPYKKDQDFIYIEEIQDSSIIERFKLWFGNIIRKFFEMIFGVGNAEGLLYFIFNILPYLLLAFLVVLLFKLFLKVNTKTIISGQYKPSTITFTKDEEIIKNENILALINDAIKQKNFRLAIRYSYLNSLKILTENNIITWESQKTNEDYSNEIQKEVIKNEFNTITKIYDYVWYGELKIDELKFESLKTHFNTLKKNLQNIE